MIITESHGLQKCIRELMSAENGKRVIAVAFIGRDALNFVPDPDGITVYCWDNVPGTHPDGIEDLYNLGAIVKFVPRLHMKLFWAQRGGLLLGSANLSNNALGDPSNGLIEIAYRSDDSKEVDISAIVRLLERNARTVDDRELAAYRKRYFAASARQIRHRTVGTTRRSITFADYCAGKSRKRWILAATDSTQELTKSDEKVASHYAAEHDYRGDKAAMDLIRGTIKSDGGIRVGDWVLQYRARRDGTAGKMSWLYVHTLGTGRRPWAYHLVFDCGREPFQIDQAFKSALNEYLKSHDVQPLLEDVRLSSANLRALLRLYQKARR